MSELVQKHKQTDAEPQCQIHIVSSLQLQNELFSNALEYATGLPCVCSSNVCLPDILNIKMGQSGPILWDCVDIDRETLWNKIGPDFPLDDVLFVLFNVNPEHKIEKQAVKRGVRGVFYRGDSLATFKKGIQAVLGGELWFSRGVLTKCLVETNKLRELPEENQVLLTFREKEILAMIAAGLSKDDIADDLGISPHTVKTHTHNIYQKINVPNRIKAAMWASRNLNYARGYLGARSAYMG